MLPYTWAVRLRKISGPPSGSVTSSEGGSHNFILSYLLLNLTRKETYSDRTFLHLSCILILPILFHYSLGTGRGTPHASKPFHLFSPSLLLCKFNSTTSFSAVTDSLSLLMILTFPCIPPLPTIPQILDTHVVHIIMTLLLQ